MDCLTTPETWVHRCAKYCDRLLYLGAPSLSVSILLPDHEFLSNISIRYWRHLVFFFLEFPFIIVLVLFSVWVVSIYIS